MAGVQFWPQPHGLAALWDACFATVGFVQSIVVVDSMINKMYIYFGILLCLNILFAAAKGIVFGLLSIISWPFVSFRAFYIFNQLVLRLLNV